jgi:hypothetical protein
MTKTPRWLKSVLAASTAEPVSLPWTRGTRRRPASLRTPPAPAPQKPGSCAAH